MWLASFSLFWKEVMNMSRKRRSIWIFFIKISTQYLIMEVDFCLVLCIPEVPVLQAFRGIGHFVWYCKTVSDLS